MNLPMKEEQEIICGHKHRRSIHASSIAD